ncbi:hypothetical protein CJ030_MR6G023244 [Morella rubra]|uniref:WAT1-related protein n=1 Tax=Morella rubra TaxID=262757 RepID=A0A6A1VG75_9ROSI|nr:hypothetical protein CJ030_MR6G023244 [Morella rubra]
MSNLMPAFTFILAVIFRMENLSLRSSITRAKVMGTILSISGALVVVLYKGPTIIPAPSKSPSLSLHFPLGSSKANWIIGGLLLAAEYLLASICYIVQQFTGPSNESVSSRANRGLLYQLECDDHMYTSMFDGRCKVKFLETKPDIALIAIIYSVRNMDSQVIGSLWICLTSILRSGILGFNPWLCRSHMGLAREGACVCINLQAVCPLPLLLLWVSYSLETLSILEGI